MLGVLVPLHLPGLGFTLTTLFAVLAVDAFRARRDIPVPALALACVLAALPVPGRTAAGRARPVHRRAAGPVPLRQEKHRDQSCLTRPT